MSTRMETLATELEALRSEIAELDVVEEPTEEQSARYDAALGEWDEKKTEHDALVSRAEKVDAVRSANIAPSNREGGAPNVIIKREAFDLSDIDRMDDKGMQIRDRALAAFDDPKSHRGVSDDKMEALLERIENVDGAARHALIHGTPAYRSGFEEYIRSQGKNMLYSAEEVDAIRASLALGGATGGYTLPTLLDPTLIHTGAATRNPIRRLARVVTGTQNVWHGVSVGNVAVYRKAEAAAFTEGSPAFSNPSVTASNLTAYVTGSYEIFEDSNLQSQLPGLIAEAFDYKEGTEFITGSGSDAPLGIVTALSGTAASTVTATTRGAFTTASAVDVFAMVNALPSRYEDSSTWVANKQTFNTIKQMSTASNGSYFWSDFNSAIGSPLLGSPIAQSSDMATAQTSGTKLIVLGDFSQYVIYDRIGTSVEFIQNVVDGSGLPTGQRGLVAHKRNGAGVTDLNAFRIFNT